uniref:Transcription factor Adf-1-like n=1 Tax=Ciona intestinalis TaxID=7719 RepID=F7ALW9_CIOIN|nr:transcription factor Adf-1-like isoform X2 [Ciona intestinalis]|eukprot:XP_002124233.1 transcription factor Adf-1-like isoform X2 [Ciona intestinalis]
MSDNLRLLIFTMTNKDFNETLINLVQPNFHLYDSKYTHYKDSTKKQNTWRYISQQIGQPADACMKRWRSLRDRFGKEKKKMDSLKTSGAGAVNCIVWEHYHHLQFLNDHLRHRLTVGNVQPAVSDETDASAVSMPPSTSYENRDDDDMKGLNIEAVFMKEEPPAQQARTHLELADDSECSSPAEPAISQHQKRKQDLSFHMQEQLISILEKNANTFQKLVSQNVPTEDMFDHFGKVIAAKLRNMPTEASDEIMIAMMQLFTTHKNF